MKNVTWIPAVLRKRVHSGWSALGLLPIFLTLYVLLAYFSILRVGYPYGNHSMTIFFFVFYLLFPLSFLSSMTNILIGSPLLLILLLLPSGLDCGDSVLGMWLMSVLSLGAQASVYFLSGWGKEDRGMRAYFG